MAADELTALADAVLPLIRSRSRDLWRYSAANEQGVRMREGVRLLELAIENPEALAREGVRPATGKEIYTAVHKAVASALTVIARADDSAGIIGDVCRDLIRLHPKAADLAQVPPVRLANWVYDFHFNNEADYFTLDPVAYAPALGQTGLARLRTRLEALRQEASPPDPGEPFRPQSRRESVLSWFDRRLAVLDRDAEAIVRTHLRDGRVAAWVEDVAAAFEEIGDIDRALEWAERATLFDLGHQSQTAARRWWRLLREHRPAAVARAAQTIFDRWPSSSSGSTLVETVGPDVIPDVQARLAAHPGELVRFQLRTMNDPRRAWTSATQLGVTDTYVWAELAEAYLPIDPVAALSVQVEIVAASVVEANTRKYRPAARKLATIRDSARALENAEALAAVDTAIADLRDQHRRRPSFLAALDRARLP